NAVDQGQRPTDPAMTVPEFLQPWLGSRPETALLLSGAAFLLLAFVLLILWLVFGRGPRRAPAFRRAPRLPKSGDWHKAPDMGRTLQGWGRHPAVWQGRLRNAEGECHHVAGDEALQARRFEESREHYLRAAELLNLDERALHERVIEAMLAEARRLFATGFDKDTQALQDLLARTLLLESPCPEASFWLGLSQLRGGQTDLALASLTKAHEGSAGRVLGPPLYLGGLPLRQGRAP